MRVGRPAKTEVAGREGRRSLWKEFPSLPYDYSLSISSMERPVYLAISSTGILSFFILRAFSLRSSSRPLASPSARPLSVAVRNFRTVCYVQGILNYRSSAFFAQVDSSILTFNDFPMATFVWANAFNYAFLL